MCVSLLGKVCSLQILWIICLTGQDYTRFRCRHNSMVSWFQDCCIQAWYFPAISLKSGKVRFSPENNETKTNKRRKKKHADGGNDFSGSKDLWPVFREKSFLLSTMPNILKVEFVDWTDRTLGLSPAQIDCMNERGSFDMAFLIWCDEDSDLFYTFYVLIMFESPWYTFAVDWAFPAVG